MTGLAFISFQSIRWYVDKTWVKTHVQSILVLCSLGLLDALQGFQIEPILANTRQIEANIPQRRCETSFVTIFNQVLSTSPQNAINLIDAVKLLAEMCDGDASVSVDVRALSGEQIIQVHDLAVMSGGTLISSIQLIWTLDMIVVYSSRDSNNAMC